MSKSARSASFGRHLPNSRENVDAVFSALRLDAAALIYKPINSDQSSEA